VFSHCPAALDLDKVIGQFQQIAAITKVKVTVITPEREYAKRVTLEEGVRALMGLIMATSACPFLIPLNQMPVIICRLLVEKSRSYVQLLCIY
jgi:uncharacterized protein YcgI (DUF1989 family)